MLHSLFGALILCLACFGAANNCAALVLLTLRQWRARRNRSPASDNANATFGVFHQLLRMLSAFDLCVVTCGALSYGLPNVWGDFTVVALPAISPYLIPAVHIALMGSVYCTVLISLERSEIGNSPCVARGGWGLALMACAL